MKRTIIAVGSAVAVAVGGFGIADAAGHGRPIVQPTSVSTHADIPVAKGTSLAEAASQPHGVGARDLKPHGKPVGPVAAPKNQNRKESDGVTVTVAGCVAGYGVAGQCLPAVPGSAAEMNMTRQQMPWTCQELNLTFPDGLPVTGKTDTLKLDSNHDGVACGSGDK